MATHGFCQWAVELAAAEPAGGGGLQAGELLGFCGFRSWERPQQGVQGELLAPLRPAMGWCAADQTIGDITLSRRHYSRVALTPPSKARATFAT